MNVKEKLIAVFENNRGESLSGEELAQRLGCSRAAVWKAVTALRAEGYAIDAVPGKGYRLAEKTDVLSAAGVEKYLSSGQDWLSLYVLKKIEGSSNTAVKDMAAANAPEGTVLICGEQTGGKGRRGRSFFSPSDTGLYMSILLRPEMPAEDSVRITTAAAAAVSQAIEECSGLSTQIKWVNDIYLNGLKVCGILTEAAFSLENGGLDYAVVGIGINAYEPEGGFPAELAGIAGAVFPGHREDMRNRLAAAVLSHFYENYKALFSPELLAYYRSRLMWQGEEIRVISGSGEYPCTMLGVTDSYALRVRLEDGTEREVSSGEITIRRIEK